MFPPFFVREEESRLKRKSDLLFSDRQWPAQGKGKGPGYIYTAHKILKSEHANWEKPINAEKSIVN